MKGLPAVQRPQAQHHQLHAGRRQQSVPFFGLGHPGKIPEDPAPPVPGPVQGTDRGEYDLLVDTARAAGRERLALLMEAICSTGVRVSEVRYLTVEAARQGGRRLP